MREQIRNAKRQTRLLAIPAALLGLLLAPGASAEAKMAQAITFSSPPNQPVAGGSYEVSATSSSGLPVSLYTTALGVSPPGCSFIKPPSNREVRPEQIDGDGAFIAEGPVAAPAVLYLTTARECRILAKVEATAEYESANASLEFAIGVDPSEQISFISIPPNHAITGERSYEPVALSSAGIDLTLYSATPSVCELQLFGFPGPGFSSHVLFLAEGICTIAASQRQQFSGPGEAEQSFTVFPFKNPTSRTIEPEISLRVPTAARVGASATIWAENRSGPEPVLSSATPSVCTVSRATDIPQGGTSASVRSSRAGTCTIVAKLGATTRIRDEETLEYQAGEATKSFRVLARKKA